MPIVSVGSCVKKKNQTARKVTCLEFFALNESVDFVSVLIALLQKSFALCKKFAFLLIFFATVFDFKLSYILNHAINLIISVSLIISAKSLLQFIDGLKPVLCTFIYFYYTAYLNTSKSLFIVFFILRISSILGFLSFTYSKLSL